MSYAASVSATGEKGTVFKVTIERGGEPELRRVRGDFTYEEMVSIVRHMWNSAPERLVIEYVDEDGDRVRVGSQLEWAEALQNFAERNERTVRLFARKGNKGGRKDGKCHRAQSVGATATANDDSDTEASPVAAAAVPRLALGRMSRMPSDESTAPAVNPLVMAACESHIDAVRAAAVDVVVGTTVGAPAANADVGTTAGDRGLLPEGAAEHLATIEILSLVFKCDAQKELADAFSTVDFRPVVSRRVNPLTCEMEVDVEKQHLRRLLVAMTNKWIGKGQLDEAEKALRAGLKLWPEDSVLFYNCACALSLRGDVDEAIECLSNAVNCGYTDATHILRDTDLANVQSHPELGGILRRARGLRSTGTEAPTTDVTPVVAEPVVVVPAAVAAAAPAPAPAAASSQLTKAEKLHAIFPFMSIVQAEQALRAVDGDLQAAVDMQLARF